MKPHGGICLTVQDLMDVHASIDHPAFGICYDPGNLIYYTKGAERPEPNIARIAPLVTTAIIKDCIVRDGVPDVAITPGEGWVDFRAVLGGLVAGGFGGPLYLECVGGKELAEIDANVRRAKGYIEDILAQL
jgi:sugar phosphate isomerase/epimerase